MLPTIPADAPAWVPHLYWVVFAVLAAVFAVFTPRLRAALAAAAPAQPDPVVRIHGPALGPAFDGVKIGHELERMADALETIAEAGKSLAKAEEAGTARALGAMAEQLARLDRKVDGR